METNIKLMVVLQKLNTVFLNRAGKNIKDLGFSISEFLILSHLNTKGQTPTQELGRIAYITSGTITHAVNKLQELGYVTKNRCQEDKRVYWVDITKEGKTYYLNMLTKHKKYLSYLLSDFSEEEKLNFIEIVKKFGKTIEKK